MIPLEGRPTPERKGVADVSDRDQIGVGNDAAVNARVIAEFRRNGGKVGGRFAGAKLLILRTTGAKTARERLTPLAYLVHGDRIHVFAAGPGLSRNPAWYHNLVAHPAVTVEIGAETFAAAARVLAGDERAQIWDLFVAEIPQLPGWQRDAGREFPIVELTRKT